MKETYLKKNPTKKIIARNTFDQVTFQTIKAKSKSPCKLQS